VANSLVAYATYLFKTFIPYPLWIPYTAQPDFAPLWKALCAAILLLAITGGVVALRRSRYLLVGWLWFLGTLVPVIGMVPFGHHIMADRFTYFPLIGLFMIWAWGLAALVAGRPSFKKPLVAAVAVVLAVCSVLAWYQVQHWRTTGTLFSHAIAVDADNYPALCNLGRYFVEQGDPKQAVQYFQRAHALKQEDMDIKNDLGVVYLFTGRYEEAAKIFREVLQKNPNDPDVHVHLGAALLSLRDYEAARAEAYKALELDPNTVRARKLLQGIAQEMRR
jgi:Tfp pilus assembly protein PilF